MIIVGHFNKDDLSIISQIELIDIYRLVHPLAVKCMFLKYVLISDIYAVLELKGKSHSVLN